MLTRAGIAHERAGEGELSVAAGFGLASQAFGGLRHQQQVAVSMLGRGVLVDCR